MAAANAALAPCWPEALPAFNDLLTRTVTGVALAVVGLGSVWLGGGWFAALVAVSLGAMLWELARLVGHSHIMPAVLGLSGALFINAVMFVPWRPEGLLLAYVPVVLGLIGLRRMRLAWAAMALAVIAACHVALVLREGGGVVWILWLLLTVVVTDVCGYFAGRAIGGRKFWPSISPKKTWAGVLAGWLGAGVVGAAFMPLTNTGEGLILVSVALSFASQMGDIGESALKRRAGVKDSSNLLPGHGGLLDRLDGVVGALVVTGIVALLTNYPEAPI